MRLGTANQCDELVGRLRASFSASRPRALHLHASLPLGVGRRQKLDVRFVLFPAEYSRHTPFFLGETAGIGTCPSFPNGREECPKQKQQSDMCRSQYSQTEVAKKKGRRL